MQKSRLILLSLWASSISITSFAGKESMLYVQVPNANSSPDANSDSPPSNPPIPEPPPPSADPEVKPDAPQSSPNFLSANKKGIAESIAVVDGTALGIFLFLRSLQNNDKKTLEKVFADFQVNKPENSKYYQKALKIFKAKTVKEAENGYVNLMKDTALKLDFKEKIFLALKMAKTPLKDEQSSPISHADLQQRLYIPERIQAEKTLKEVFSETALSNPEIRSYYRKASEAINAVTKQELENCHKRLMRETAVAPEIKERIANILKNAQIYAKDKNGTLVSSVEIQQRLDIFERIQDEKTLTDVFSETELSNPDIKGYYQQARDTINATNKEDLKRYHEGLMTNTKVDPLLKEKATNVLDNLLTHVKDRDGNFIPHTDFQQGFSVKERVQDEKSLQEIFSEKELKRPEVAACYENIHSALNAVNKEYAELYYIEVRNDRIIPVEMKEKAANALENFHSYIRDEKGNIVYAAEIIHKVDIQAHIEDEKTLKEVFSGQDLNKPEIKKYYQGILDYIDSAENEKVAKNYCKRLIQNTEVPSELKQKVNAFLENTHTQIKDRDGKVIPYAEINQDSQRRIKDDVPFQEIFSGQDMSNETIERYKQEVKNYLDDAQYVEEAEASYRELMQNTEVSPDLKKKVDHFLENAHTQIKDKDRKVVPYAEIKQNFQEKIKDNQKIKEIFSKVDINKEGNYSYHLNALGALNANTVEGAQYYYKKMMQNTQVDIAFKEQVIQVLEGAQSRIRNKDGILISHAEIQQQLSMKERLQTEKTFAQVFSEEEGKSTANKAYCCDVRRVINAPTAQEAGDYYKNLMENTKVDPTLKERISTFLVQKGMPVEDEKGIFISHHDLQYSLGIPEQHLQDKKKANKSSGSAEQKMKQPETAGFSQNSQNHETKEEPLSSSIKIEPARKEKNIVENVSSRINNKDTSLKAKKHRGEKSLELRSIKKGEDERAEV